MRKQLGLFAPLLLLSVSTLLWTSCSNQNDRCCQPCEPVCAPRRPVCPAPCRPVCAPKPCRPVCAEPCQPIRSGCQESQSPMMAPQGNQESFQAGRPSYGEMNYPGESQRESSYDSMPGQNIYSPYGRSQGGQEFNNSQEFDGRQEYDAHQQFDGRQQFDGQQFDGQQEFDDSMNSAGNQAE